MARTDPLILSDKERGDMLRLQLARLLRCEDYGSLCMHEPFPGDDGAAARFGRGLLIVFWLTATISACQVLHPSVIGALGLAVAAAVAVLGVFVLAARMGEWTAVPLTLVWPGTLVVRLALGASVGAIAVAYGIPLTLVAIPWVLRRLRLATIRDLVASTATVARNVPLLAPVALVVLFIPLFTADLWQAADSITLENGVALAVITVGLVAVLLRFALQRTLQQVISSRAGMLQAAADPLSQLVAEAKRVGGSEDGALVDQLARDVVEPAFAPPTPREYAPYVGAALRRSFRRHIDQRLLPLVAAAAVLLSGYFYVLAALAIDREVVRRWVGAAVETTSIDVWFVHFDAPCGPYPRVALLLGLAATAVYLAFVLTEDRYSEAIADALIHRPLDRCLALAVPYLYLDERELLGGDGPVGHSRDEGSSDGAEGQPDAGEGDERPG